MNAALENSDGKKVGIGPGTSRHASGRLGPISCESGRSNTGAGDACTGCVGRPRRKSTA
jgi:hypothetical protein